MKKQMRFYFLTLIFLIFLLLSCTQSKTKDNHSIQNIPEITNTEQASVNNSPVDQPIIIGGYKTGYTLLTRPASSYSIIISHARCADFSGIEQIADMERLRISLPETSDIDFSPLKALSQLRYIRISGLALTKIPDLSGIPSLTMLELNNNRLTSLIGLERLPQLNWLHISEAHVPVTDTTALRYLKKLQELYIFDGSYNIDFNNFGEMLELDFMYLANCGELDLSGIGQLAQLKKLELIIAISEETGKQSVFKNIEEIGRITGLKELHLDELITSIEFLANNVNLERLELVAGRHLPDYFKKAPLPLNIAPLGNLKKLKYLAIRGFDLKNAHVLETLPELETLDTDLYKGE
jgi:Leucine-rich repeat (LRR) protein